MTSRLTTDIIGLPPHTVLRVRSGVWDLRIGQLDPEIAHGRRWRVDGQVVATDQTILDGVSGNTISGEGRTLAAAVRDAGLEWEDVHDDVMSS